MLTSQTCLPVVVEVVETSGEQDVCISPLPIVAQPAVSAIL